QFEIKFKKNNRFNKYWNYSLCFAIIVFSLFMLYSLETDKDKFSGSNTFYYLGFGFLLLLGIYGLYVLENTYKLSFCNNELTKEENVEALNLACSELLKTEINLDDNYANFIYKKSWWRMPYEVHLFADNNIIAINVEGIDTYDRSGFIDFGASKRTQNKILNLIKEKAYEHTQNRRPDLLE